AGVAHKLIEGDFEGLHINASEQLHLLAHTPLPSSCETAQSHLQVCGRAERYAVTYVTGIV
ncbi:MAG TPA: hypothetical protein VGR88_00805, partial [Ktedonobacterales bacterium]|nr:hypothetical protein [Ktedonobacterales bacterium]